MNIDDGSSSASWVVLNPAMKKADGRLVGLLQVFDPLNNESRYYSPVPSQADQECFINIEMQTLRTSNANERTIGSTVQKHMYFMLALV